MKKLIVLLIVSFLFSPVIAHSGDHTNRSQLESNISEYQDESQSSFAQFYPEYRSGLIWMTAGVLGLIGATALSVRHYFGKSEYGSLKEFIGEDVV